MKVSSEIRNIYSEYKPIYELLGSKVRELLNAKKSKRWHYEDRIKDLESYATKLETGRFETRIEDFFACTLVVENLSARKEAEELIKSEFKIHYRRPKKSDFTHKSSDAFPFDDLRIYISWVDIASKSVELDDIVFEVQIKTFLQHAWSIATHDLIYKSSEKNWAKERIAYQVKAMLEHAEISIFEANSLSKSSSLAITNESTDKLQRAIKIIRRFWPDAFLPRDISRLAENILSLIENINISESALISIINKENKNGRGCNTLNLSPFGTIVQGIFNQHPESIIKYLQGKEKKYKIFITKDIEIPPNINIDSSLNLRRVV